MAVQLDIRNLKNRKDLKQKEDNFFRTLRLQAKLNDEYQRAMNERFRNEQLGITGVTPVQRSLQEDADDKVLQRQIADTNLRSILRVDEAQRVLTRLTEDEVYALNSNFKGIEKALEGETNILSSSFYSFFRRYLQAKASKELGIDMTNQEMLDTLTGDIMRRERENVEAPPAEAPPTPTAPSAPPSPVPNAPPTPVEQEELLSPVSPQSPILARVGDEPQPNMSQERYRDGRAKAEEDWILHWDGGRKTLPQSLGLQYFEMVDGVRTEEDWNYYKGYYDAINILINEAIDNRDQAEQGLLGYLRRWSETTKQNLQNWINFRDILRNDVVRKEALLGIDIVQGRGMKTKPKFNRRVLRVKR